MFEKFKNIVILTGAGISAESGIQTFRASEGLWENHLIEDVATPEGFLKNPELVHQFYNARRNQLKSISPNTAHYALAELEKNWEGDFLLVTQNVDNLHKKAGSRFLIHMHGELNKIFCTVCKNKFTWEENLSSSEVCNNCKNKGTLRPDIVWFGEIPYKMEQIFKALHNADLFISIGTSGKVYPAAGFARQAWKAYKIEINIEPSDISKDFDEHRIGLASVEVPKLIKDLLLI